MSGADVIEERSMEPEPGSDPAVHSPARGGGARAAAEPSAVPGGGATSAAEPLTVPRYSIVIPIHNEAECLEGEVASLVGELDARSVDYELLLAENGSTDQTPAIADRLAAHYPRVRTLHLSAPDYGLAMKTGMLTARGDYVVNFDIDFHDVDFLLNAGSLLDSCGVVVGSKLMPGSEDKRSGARHMVSLGFTTILRLLFDPRMDDTHGMKALRREVVQRFAPQTVMSRDIWDTELIIRARRGGVVVKALPVTVEEKRKPRSSIVRRIPRTMKGLLRLRLVLWREGKAGS